MNYHEKESFLKSFLLFFIALLSMGSLALVLYSKEQQSFYKLQLLVEMDAFSYTLKGDRFLGSILEHNASVEMHQLIITDEAVYAYFTWVKNPDYEMVKVSYPYEKYTAYLRKQSQKMWMLFLALFFLSGTISLLFTRYTLVPMRNSLVLMENFLKDIIHDLNTPVSSILLNTQLLKRKYLDEEITRITLGTQTIHSLSKNLEAMYRDMPSTTEAINLGKFLEERMEYFRYIYPNLRWSLCADEDVIIQTSRDCLIRIVDNLLSNAGKYNHKEGSVMLTYTPCSFKIRDTGVGIEQPKKVFERFYKESQRGLGLGLHIVKSFVDKTGMKISLKSEVGKGTEVEIHFC